MVGFHGRHHGDKSGQQSGVRGSSRGIPSGLREGIVLRTAAREWESVPCGFFRAREMYGSLCFFSCYSVLHVLFCLYTFVRRVSCAVYEGNVSIESVRPASVRSSSRRGIFLLSLPVIRGVFSQRKFRRSQCAEEGCLCPWPDRYAGSS